MTTKTRPWSSSSPLIVVVVVVVVVSFLAWPRGVCRPSTRRRTVSSTPPRRSTRRAMTMDSTMDASSRVDSTFGRRGLTVEM